MNTLYSAMPREHLWIGKLSKNEKEIFFCPDDDTEVTESVSHSLLIKWIMLGPSATPDEVNIVRINTSPSGSSDAETSAPLCGLVASKEKRFDQVMMDILVPHSKIKFTLAEGSGPITIFGQHVPEFSHPGMDSEDENVEEEEEDEEETEELVNLLKKRKNANNSEPAKKVAKVAVSQQVDEEDEELDSEQEEEDSSDYEPPANSSSRKILKAKRVTKGANIKKVK